MEELSATGGRTLTPSGRQAGELGPKVCHHMALAIGNPRPGLNTTWIADSPWLEVERTVFNVLGAGQQAFEAAG